MHNGAWQAIPARNNLDNTERSYLYYNVLYQHCKGRDPKKTHADRTGVEQTTRFRFSSTNRRTSASVQPSGPREISRSLRQRHRVTTVTPRRAATSLSELKCLDVSATFQHPHQFRIGFQPFHIISGPEYRPPWSPRAARPEPTMPNDVAQPVRRDFQPDSNLSGCMRAIVN